MLELIEIVEIVEKSRATEIGRKMNKMASFQIFA
jgi:hypothetical protein